ncbi:MAG: glycosyltransferase [Colwellia sp.]|nr:glycosyltransferase [Colwellia sp.]
MNILFVIDRLENGGAERQLLNVANYITDGNDIHITSLHIPSDNMILQIKKYGFVYHNIAANSGVSFISRVFGVFSLITGLKKVVKKNKIDKCISFLEWSNILSIIIARNCKIPVIINVRNFLSRQYGSRSKLTLFIAKLVIQTFYPKAAKVICNSFGIKEDLIERFSIPESKISVIHNTYPIVKILTQGNAAVGIGFSKADEVITFCACGRLSDQKRFESMVLSFQEYCLKNNRNDILIIMGDGPNKKVLQQIIDKQTGNIKLLSHQDNPHAIIANSDCFILHSDFEGFPNVLAEAVILGKDCISVDCLTGPREVLSGNIMTDYTSEIKTLHVMKFGLLYPYSPMGIEIDRGLVNAFTQYSINKYKFDKSDYAFLCEKKGKIKWQKAL